MAEPIISVKNVGHHESYTCHKSRIPKNAKPISAVRFLFSLSPLCGDSFFFIHCSPKKRVMHQCMTLLYLLSLKRTIRNYAFISL